MSPKVDPRETWRRASRLLGSLGTVDPVLVGPDGELHFPTGEVSVRFKEPPSEAELDQFAARYGLRFVKGNEFVPAQMVFARAHPMGVFLPELVEQLARSDAVRAAWANTVSRYRRI